MIAFLKGTIKSMEESNVILDVNDVGYEIHISKKTASDIAHSEIVELHIYTLVREDSFKLYGFSQALEKQMFIAFLRINGVGPKMTLSLLSSAPSIPELVDMIESEDLKGLSSLPRVGKKIAQQIVLGLKGKMKIEGRSNTKKSTVKERDSLYFTLTNLGFRSNEIKMVLDQVKISPDPEENLKQALSYLQPLNSVVQNNKIN